MTRKQVWQYRCDFCGRKRLSASACAKHEKHCTANPDRVCRMCAALDCSPLPLAELRAMIPVADAKRTHTGWNFEDFAGAVDPADAYRAELAAQFSAALPAFEEAADGCPACMLAAIRQNHLPGEIGFDFKKRGEAAFSEKHNAGALRDTREGAEV